LAVFKVDAHMPEVVSQAEKNKVSGFEIVFQNRFACSGLLIGVPGQRDLEFCPEGLKDKPGAVHTLFGKTAEFIRHALPVLYLLMQEPHDPGIACRADADRRRFTG